MHKPVRFFIGFFTILATGAICAEPVVLSGSSFPSLVGRPVSALRIIGGNGAAIPFQIDEKTESGEYISNGGSQSNADSAHATLQNQDEIVFLAEDAEESARTGAAGISAAPHPAENTITLGGSGKKVFFIEDSTLPLSPERYISYDAQTHSIRTPWYYAQFSPDRFHFIRAGIMEGGYGRYLDLTRKLKIELSLKTLWGIFPIRYNEDNIMCIVKRYKVGPIRLIRRGDFFLRMGLFGLKGSRAIVYQKCYPQAVEVPVHVHLPIRLGSLFSEAYLEMTPVIQANGKAFSFSIPGSGVHFGCTAAKPVDTFIHVIPDRGYIFSDGAKGFAWITRVGIDDARLQGSGYVFRCPSRDGIAECGVRYTVRNLPRGDYAISNWVIFPRSFGYPAGGDCMSLLPTRTIAVGGKNAADLFNPPSDAGPTPGKN
jgi:hypothetical protein